MGLVTGTATAQSTAAGTIVGTVTDQSGAVVPSASVTVIDTATNEKRTNSTNDAGRFVFANVPPGSYEVIVSRTGFKATKTTQSVDVGMVATVNVSLEVGSVTQEIVVEAAGAQLQTTNATIGTTMTFDMAQSLPGLSRDVSGLALLQPATTPVNGTAGQAGSVAGSNADQNMFVLDGGNNSSDMDGTNTVYLNGFAGNPITGGGSAIPNGVVPTPIESIEEFKVGVAGQTADFNAAAGSQMSMVTRRGGNAWHGTAYEYYYGTNFSANSWANNHSPSTDPKTGATLGYTPLPSRHQNRFGASAGGPVLPFDFLGGKTYIFGFYQGVRFPNVTTLEKATPSDLLRAGVIQVQNSSSSAITLNGVSYAPSTWMPFNLNPGPVTVNGVTYQPANVCGAAANQSCDPRKIGINPIVNQIWSQYMPAGNDLAPSSTIADSFNTIGYKGTIRLPQSDNNWVVRLDHDFGKNWHFMSSYRYYKLSQADSGQVDVGGILPGATKGQYTATRNLPSLPSIFVAGLSTTISSRLTNDFHYSYTRNWWQWGDAGAPPQPIPGLGGAVEIGGESYYSLNPYNVDTQDVRTRFWDGQDHMLRDDLNLLSGNHLFQFGGLYQRNFDFHDRNDNGQGTMAANVYQVTDGSGISWSGFLPPTSIVPSSQQGNFQSLAAQVLGLVAQPQTLYTRAGSDLHLLPLGTHAQDKSVIPFYQAYWSDTWKMKPSFTLTYGLSYSLEMPPYELSGKQVMLVDQSNNPVRLANYLAQRKSAALAGQVYDPVLGFSLVNNVAGGRKYPYDPFYTGFSPRLAAAWSPHFDSGILGSIFGNGQTVVRGGYSRIYGRLNGVNLVLVPLLGTGIMQGVACVGAVGPASAVGGNQCLGSGGSTPATAFRIGTDGLVAPLGGAPSNTLAQPYFPGVGGNLAAAPGSGLDPGTRPSSNDSFTLSIQREISPKLYVEAGYIGKLIHNEFQEINVDAVPYMTTLGGQTFANAYANLYTALCGLNVQVCPAANVSTPAPQPWIEQALGGPTSAFCKTASSCTAALVASQRSLITSNRVYDLWNAMETSSSWTLGMTNPGMNPPGGCPKTITPTTVCRQFQAFEFDASNGYGNYNGLFTTVTFRDWHGVTARSNFTWGRSLGTGGEVQARSTRTVLDPWNLGSEYGPNGFDVKFIYNLALDYAPSFHKSQQGALGRLLGGWSIAPLFTAQSGFPLNVVQQDGSGTSTSREAFGQSDPSQSAIYNVVLTNGSFSGGNSLNYLNTAPSGSVGTTATTKNAAGTSVQWLNMFGNPTAAYSQFRRLILGVDTRGNGFGIIRGFPRWNVDMTVAKDIRVTERVGLNFTAMMTNVLNHFQPADPTSMNLNSPATFGRVSAQATGYDSRQIEFGLRLRW